MTMHMLHLNDTTQNWWERLWDVGAIGKARHDREIYAQQIGVRLIDAFIYHWTDEPRQTRDARFDGIFAGLKRGDIVFVQWEVIFDENQWIQDMINRIHVFGAKLVFIVDDIMTWRLTNYMPEKPDPKDYPKYQNWREVTFENHFLAQAQGLILQSHHMATRLAAQFAVSGQKLPPVTYYGPYGYSTVYYSHPRQLGHGVDYAGDLNKARFLLHLPTDIRINVFGKLPDDMSDLATKIPNIHFHDYVDPEAMPTSLHGSFGLIWDSDSYPEVTGSFGDYERYNSPAKMSTYLAANEPIIIWRQSPFAPWVEANHIGIVIDNLAQLPDKLKAIDDKAYEEMTHNVGLIGELVRNGKYLKKAISDMELALDDPYFFKQGV